MGSTSTTVAIGDGCIANNQNFRDMFHLPALPTWLGGRAARAVARVMAVMQAIRTWTLDDALIDRLEDLTELLARHVFNSGMNATACVADWGTVALTLPGAMKLGELLQFLGAETEAEQEAVLETVNVRLGAGLPAPAAQKRIRILTMHGAKGLSGSIVFIPSAEQGIVPSFRALHATGLLNEQRRLFYVSMTRARACCIVLRALSRSGAASLSLTQRPTVQLPALQFMLEAGLTSRARDAGLDATEARAIVTDVNTL